MRGQRWRSGRLAGVAAGVLSSACLLVAPVGADLLTTDRTLADFTFLGAAVDYAPDPKTFALSANRDLEFTSADPDLGFGVSSSSHDSLRGSLHIGTKADNFGNFISADFNLFGSLPTLSNLPEARLATDTVRALRPDSKPGGFEFLIDRDRIIGPLASRYRSVGMFTVVAGVDDLTWVQGFADGAATMEMIRAEEATTLPSTVQGIPLPATLGLVAAGLALLPRRRHTRARPKTASL
ncbi:MAG TPA: hypothetical protein VES73_05855 [Lamprocystis sp. (in: g-proteobacteria)]|nr:hypothetical protein [Lamprocystis sp. (in: g-proteobacteria)]